jgi:hypothetical protein
MSKESVPARDDKAKLADDTAQPTRTSTGPRTQIGKAISSQNARKHGIFSSVIQLKSDSRTAYNALLNGLFEYFDPQGTLEEILVEKLAVLTWRYRRLVASEPIDLDGSENFGIKARDSFIISTFPRYESSIERSFERTLNQLERHQRMRKGQEIPAPISVDLST